MTRHPEAGLDPRCFAVDVVAPSGRRRRAREPVAEARIRQGATGSSLQPAGSKTRHADTSIAYVHDRSRAACRYARGSDSPSEDAIRCCPHEARSSGIVLPSNLARSSRNAIRSKSVDVVGRGRGTRLSFRLCSTAEQARLRRSTEVGVTRPSGRQLAHAASASLSSSSSGPRSSPNT